MKCILMPFILFTALLAKGQTAQSLPETKSNANDKLLMAVAWYQYSAEMEALYYQGFNIASQRLDEAVAADTTGKPLAIIVDIDETMLNNSPFEAVILNGGNFQSGWSNWVAGSNAKALPGALEFVKYAQSRKADIFYITNRTDIERAATLKNLQNEGFPYADDYHLLTRGDLSFSNGNTSSKEGRRLKVAEKYEIALLIGDNLNDFSVVFEDRKANNGKDAVGQNRLLFGKKFIVLPNPIYGAWEKPLVDFREGLSEDEKTNIIKAKLKVN